MSIFEWICIVGAASALSFIVGYYLAINHEREEWSVSFKKGYDRGFTAGYELGRMIR